MGVVIPCARIHEHRSKPFPSGSMTFEHDDVVLAELRALAPLAHAPSHENREVLFPHTRYNDIGQGPVILDE